MQQEPLIEGRRGSSPDQRGQQIVKTPRECIAIPRRGVTPIEERRDQTKVDFKSDTTKGNFKADMPARRKMQKTSTFQDVGVIHNDSASTIQVDGLIDSTSTVKDDCASTTMTPNSMMSMR